MVLLRKKQSRGTIENLYEISPIRAFFIGMSQALSVFPGVSRLGITMIAGILLGIEKRNAIKFSFLLGLPTMFAGTIYELITTYSSGSTIHIQDSLEAFFFTFCFSILFIKILISILTNLNIKFFGYYRIILGTIILWFLKIS
jgi:undecaprenyl-diphosphatase